MGFFERVLPETSGWVPIMSNDDFGRLTKTQWFHWPTEASKIADYVEALSERDAYWSPMLFTEPPSTTSSRHCSKANVSSVACVWADGDDMPLDGLLLHPTTLVKSSPHRWQGYWRISDEGLSPLEFEEMSRALYDAHAAEGIDRGWALAKRLRLPFTVNTKPQYGVPYRVNYEESDIDFYSREEFLGEYPIVHTVRDADFGDMPAPDPNRPFEVLTWVNDSTVNDLFTMEPKLGDDWSAISYRLECLLWEADVDVQDAFQVLCEAACNKYRRDGRPDSDLWTQVCRDRIRWEDTNLDLSFLDVPRDSAEEAAEEDLVPERTIRDVTPDGLYWKDVDLLSEDERIQAPSDTFVDAFVTWAQSRSKQSPWEFNVAGAVMLMSSTLARYAKLPLSFGDMPLNTYFQVLGRTTQSRKTTSMKLAREIIRDITEGEVDQYWVPDDSTPEALIEWLSQRPHASTVYVVDEWQDVLTAAARKGSYTAGLVPFLTKAYDGTIPGVLRKTGAVRYQKGTEHYMSFYGTGILNQAADALTEAKIESGFVPRCLTVVDGRTGFNLGAQDVSFRDPDAQQREDAYRKVIGAILAKALNYWNTVEEENSHLYTANEDSRVALSCDEDAFTRWQQYAYDLMRLASEHPQNPRAMFPTCERLSYSALRVAALLAMTEMQSRIEMRHVLKAISLASSWVQGAEVLVSKVCSNEFSKDIQAVESWLAQQRDGAAIRTEVLAKFQGRFNDPKRLDSVLSFCQGKGTIREEITGKGPSGRVLKYVPYVGGRS